MLSTKEIKALVKLIGKLKTPLPEEVFDALNKAIPFAACEMVIADKKNGFLLTYRQDEFWQGWHFPGSIIRSGEEFAQVLKRIAQEELGVKLKSFKFLFPMNYPKGARGHSVSFVFFCNVSGKFKDGKFFNVMPKNIIREHRHLFKNLKKLV